MRLGTLLLHRVVVLILIDERFNKHNANYSLREWSRIENSNDTRTARTSRPTADPLQLWPREQTFLVRDFGLSFDLVSCNHRIQWLMMVLISPRNPGVKRSILKRAVSSIYHVKQSTLSTNWISSLHCQGIINRSSFWKRAWNTRNGQDKFFQWRDRLSNDRLWCVQVEYTRFWTDLSW